MDHYDVVSVIVVVVIVVFVIFVVDDFVIMMLSVLFNYMFNYKKYSSPSDMYYLP